MNITDFVNDLVCDKLTQAHIPDCDHDFVCEKCTFFNHLWKLKKAIFPLKSKKAISFGLKESYMASMSPYKSHVDIKQQTKMTKCPHLSPKPTLYD